MLPAFIGTNTKVLKKKIMKNIYFSDLRIPFPTRRHAEIAYDVLRIDPEPKRSGVTKKLQLESNDLIA